MKYYVACDIVRYSGACDTIEEALEILRNRITAEIEDAESRAKDGYTGRTDLYRIEAEED